MNAGIKVDFIVGKLLDGATLYRNQILNFLKFLTVLLIIFCLFKMIWVLEDINSEVSGIEYNTREKRY